MTTLPKRKPARRTTMRPKPQPGPQPEPERRLDWAALTAPLDTAPPVIITPDTRAAWMELADEIRAMGAAHQDLLDRWHADAQWATFGPLLDWMHRDPAPVMMP